MGDDDNKTYSSAQPTTSEGRDMDTKFRFQVARPPFKSHITRHVSSNTVFGNLVTCERFLLWWHKTCWPGLGMHWVFMWQNNANWSRITACEGQGSSGKVFELHLVRWSARWDLEVITCLSEMTQNYQMLGERYPKPNTVVGGSILGHKIFSILDAKILAMWPYTFCVPKIKEK